MKTSVAAAIAAATLLIGAEASARTVFVPTPVGFVAVISPRPVVRRAIVVAPRPVCVRHFRHWRCR